MKRKIAFLCMFVLAVSLMVGCTKKDSSKKNTDASGSNPATEENPSNSSESGNTDWEGLMPEDSYEERAILRDSNLSRIYEVMQRAEAGEDIVIGFLGGSITMGSGASNASSCYAARVFDWWETTFPKANFTYVNAGIGATDSKFGCARAYDDLLQYHPDFVVLEFSVNDNKDTSFSESYESLLRKILTYETNPALLILNMVTYDTGYNAAEIHNALAFKYSLPVVSMKSSIYEDILNGVIAAKDVSSDMTHPNNLGHEYAARIVTYFLEKVYAKAYPEANYSAYSVPTATHNAKLYYVNAKRMRNPELNAIATLNGFVPDESAQNGITDVFKLGYEAYNEGDSMTFTVTGSIIALQYRRSKSCDCPEAIAIIDGNEEFAVPISGNFENGWGDWLYFNQIYKGDEGEHTVEIRLTSSGTHSFYLVSVITASLEE